MRTCGECWGHGKVRDTTDAFVTLIACPACKGSGVTAAPRSEGPKTLCLTGLLEHVNYDAPPDEIDLYIEEELSGKLSIDNVQLDADAERQLYELLKLRAEQGPPAEGKK